VSQVPSDETPRCWCGNGALEPFSLDYLRCGACDTLVAARMPGPEIGRVTDEAVDFYGREYWFSHQERVLGLANIQDRARHDLPERCLYWLRTALRYRLPPARVLEVGCGHGGFVALLRLAGFEAAGLELSPWVVRFARETFRVPMWLGPIEEQGFEPESMDMIVLMDVLEHLRDPRDTLARCLALLRPDGILLIQTPRYPEGQSYEDLAVRHDRFLECLLPGEHLYLFSVRSVRELFRRIGAPHVNFEPAFFPEYDMFAVAGRQPLGTHAVAGVERALAGHPGGRFLQAFLDLSGRFDEAEARWARVEADRAARLMVIEEQGARLGEMEGERNRLQAEVRTLQEQTKVLQADRAARLAVIERQGARLGELEEAHRRLSAEVATLSALAAHVEMQDHQTRVLLGQQRILQEIVSTVLASRGYRVLRRLGYWKFMDRMLTRSAAQSAL
jgi:2-polyprenyl-3-methyl-5-hydroxy-6-metoxy-1,4-benzoquinol methylase